MATHPMSDAFCHKAMELVAEHGSISNAARATGINRETLQHRVNVARQRGIGTTNEQLDVLHGFSPAHGLTHTVPSPLIVRGTSTNYDKDGNITQQWVKTKLGDIQLSQLIETIYAQFIKSFEGLSPLVPSPKVSNEELLATYVLGDPHMGLYAWAKESGDDFDTDIARKITIGAVDRLISSAPNADTAILLSVGDTIHSDNQANTTTAGTGVDVDTRFSKVLEVAIDTFRHMIIRLLQKHKRVVVRLVKGNHDTHSHLALGFALRGYFSNNKRVEIDISPADFWYYRFGKVLIGSTHGDKTKQESLLGIMVSDRPQDVGETKHRYFYTGHIHHQVVKEMAGLTCESFQTLAPKDAWHSSKGYRSGRSMMCIVHNKEHGEIERHRCDIGMIV